MLTLDVLRDVAPKKTRSLISQELVDQINGWNEDPKLLGAYTENLLTYMRVLQTGKYKMTDYMNAVRFVSYKLIGHSDIDAYAIAFPERYQKLIDAGEDRNAIAPYVSMYKKGDLVTKIFEQTVIPTRVLNNHMAQESLNELMKIGKHGRSEMARVAALSKVLDKTDALESTKIELDMSVSNTDAIAELRKATEDYALQLLKNIEAGQTVKSIAEANIIEAEIEDAV